MATRFTYIAEVYTQNPVEMKDKGKQVIKIVEEQPLFAEVAKRLFEKELRKGLKESLNESQKVHLQKRRKKFQW